MEKHIEKLVILHFNDVYNLEEGSIEPVGGVARFKTALHSFKHLDPLILFSGDLFQPSLRTMYNGEQMIQPANEFGIDVACIGNHEFDLELDMLEGFIKRTNFPWLLSNVKDAYTGQCFVGSKEYHILTKYNLKIGFVGLAERDWLHVVNCLDEEDMAYEGYIECAQRLTKLLREDHKCDLVIALTHMRTYNDIKLAEGFTGFDIILGGHDHVNLIDLVNGTYVIKSGSDFREFNKIIMSLSPIPNETQEQGTPDNTNKDEKAVEAKNEYIPKRKFRTEVTIETIHVTKNFEPDPSLKAHTEYYLDLFQKTMELPIGFAMTELETRFAKIRSSEQDLTNFIADIMRLETESDVALLNTGTVRSNLLFPRGIFKMGDIRLMLPYADLVLQLELTGEQLLKALENGVSKYPAHEGRFPAVSGIRFVFDPKREPNNRILLETVKIGGQPIDLERKYTLATKAWIMGGKDGYEVFTQVRQVTEEGIAEELHNTIKRFFELGHDHYFVELFKAEKNGQPLPEFHDKAQHNYHRKLHFYEKMKVLISDIVNYEGQTYVAIDPKVEGRITIL